MINKRYDVASKSRGALITTSYKPEKSSNHLHIVEIIILIDKFSESLVMIFTADQDQHFTFNSKIRNSESANLFVRKFYYKSYLTSILAISTGNF
ncbi:unnamed protein product [Rhizophagus irregularis]|nr:unnamed protein product [Rhizophagus irregularis]